MVKRHEVTDKWHMWCADCGRKNHKNNSGCKRCGYGSDGEPWGVSNKRNVGNPEYTSDGESGKCVRSQNND